MTIKENCIEIYKKAFGDDAIFTQRLFDICFNNCRYVLYENEVASFCFLLPCKLINNEDEKDTFYVFAVATKEELRGRGFMKKLFTQIEDETNLPLILRPANENLVALYSKLGFKKGSANALNKGKIELLPVGSYELLVNGEEDIEPNPFTVMFKGVNPTDYENIYFPFSMP